MLWYHPFVPSPIWDYMNDFKIGVWLAQANQKGNLILKFWLIEEGKTIFPLDARFWASNKAICKVRTASEMYADYSQFI